MIDQHLAFCIVLSVFAGIGLVVTVGWVAELVIRAWRVVVNLDESLREGVAVLKEWRADLAVLRQFQNGSPNSGEPAVDPPEPQRNRPSPAPFPAPFFERFERAEVDEPEAVAEDVDATPTDEEILDNNRIENLREMGIHAEPNGQTRPAGREVDAE